MLMNRSILCNCDVEAESNFLLESLAACENLETKADLEMYFTLSLAFVNYFKNAIEDLGFSISTNWTTQEQVLPILVEIFDFDPKLPSASRTLHDFVTQHKTKRKSWRKRNKKK